MPEAASVYRRWFGLPAAVVVVVVTLLLMEGLTRIFAPQITYAKASGRFIVDGRPDFSLPFYEVSKTFPFTLTPHFRGHFFDTEYGSQFSVALNGAGYRTYEFSPKASDEIRIVVIGDSTTFGIGVDEDETYPKILESLLNREASGRPVFRVFNLGMVGYGPAEYYLVAKTWIPVITPDVVVIAFFTGNDRMDLWRSDVELDTSGLPVRVRRKETYVDGQHRLRTNAVESWVYNWPIARNSHLAIFLPPLIARVIGFVERKGVRFKDAHRPIQLDRLIHGMEAISAQAGAKTLWVILPASYDLDSGEDSAFLEALATLSAPHVVNIVPDFQRTSGAPQAYYIDGSHLNRQGGERVAQALRASVDETLRPAGDSARAEAIATRRGGK